MNNNTTHYTQTQTQSNKMIYKIFITYYIIILKILKTIKAELKQKENGAMSIIIEPPHKWFPSLAVLRPTEITTSSPREEDFTMWTPHHKKPATEVPPNVAYFQLLTWTEEESSHFAFSDASLTLCRAILSLVRSTPV